ncbi:hypothetical protein H696_05733 [Fonticula alba]|uniref:CYRIA/CYRIB Rac1 binding domain-containing protein n=1 Tax=Fonticula alba TaxID=691883 RepID=A0A058Z0X7_FONAL|nr:hypothetical protein H696_05733 [Fonticula alba]KCV67791.1 hypothetical protein H696_05733 [Fonticula alba]|eukprot:XP_009497822.1 hypothetical protein H696_05733 [Fonticula alba]
MADSSLDGSSSAAQQNVVADALLNVKALASFSFSDDQPPLEFPSKAISAEVSWSDGSRLDAPAFRHEKMQFMSEQLQQIATLEERTRVGESFIHMLYAYRGVSGAIPQVRDHDEANKAALYAHTYQVLKPLVDKMKELMAYMESSVNTVCKILVVANEARKSRGSPPSEELLLALARVFNMFISLDGLKDMKSSLNNDFAIYKRALSNMKKQTNPNEDETMENQKLYNFLGNKDEFARELRKTINLDGGPGAIEDVLADLLDKAADIIERRTYITADNKHTLLKAMGFSLYLLDSDQSDKAITKNKKVKLDRLMRLFKATPYMPLTGDMTLSMQTLLLKTSLREVSWVTESPGNEDNSLRRAYSLLHTLPEARAEFREYLAELGTLRSEFRRRQRLMGAAGGAPADTLTPVPPLLSSPMYNVLLRGLQLLGRLTTAVIEQSAWKLAHPTDSSINPDCPENAHDYEKSVRYNYSSAEKTAFVEYLSMVYSLKRTLAQAEAPFGHVIYSYIHATLQRFAHGSLAEVIASVAKKSKQNVLVALGHAFNVIADSTAAEGTDIVAQVSDKKAKKAKKASGSGAGMAIEQAYPERAASVSQAQLFTLRALLDSVYNEKAPGMRGGFMKDKDLSSEQAGLLDAVFQEAHFFPVMLSFGASVEAASDLSELWYKEFYLGLRKEIQFPIEMSLPWILTEHVLNPDDAHALIESVLYPLELYNDAAGRAIHKLRSRFLFDEIQAEVNLAFDQFIFALSNAVFEHYKQRASSVLINKEYKLLFEENISSDGRLEVTVLPFESVLRQRHFQLLGRSVDISRLVSQRISANLRQAVEVAIQRFEAAPLHGVLELKALLEHNRMTHELLSAVLPLESFDMILEEADEETNLVAFHGRIVSHVVYELVNDFLPNYCYNIMSGRFVLARLSMIDPLNRPSAPRPLPHLLFGSRIFNNHFSRMFDLYREYFGEVHFNALYTLLGRAYFPVILGELVNNARTLFEHSLRPFVSALMRGMPQSSKLPAFVYGVTGSYEYFFELLRPVITYGALRTEVFQVFREIGNTIIVLQLLDRASFVGQPLATMLTAPFLGIRAPGPKPSPAGAAGPAGGAVDAPPPESPTGSVADGRYVVADVLAANGELLASSGTVVDFATLGRHVEALTKAQLGGGRSLLGSFLASLSEALDSTRSEWLGATPSNDVLEVDMSKEYYRIWSACQFTFCTPPITASGSTTRESFGEGLQFGGLVFIYLLGQQHRFDVFDFSYHLIQVAGNETQLGRAGGVDLGRFVDLARFCRLLNDEIFRVFRAHMPLPAFEPALSIGQLPLKKPAFVGRFSPPGPDSADGSGTYHPFAGVHGDGERIGNLKAIAVTEGAGAPAPAASE